MSLLRPLVRTAVGPGSLFRSGLVPVAVAALPLQSVRHASPFSGVKAKRKMMKDIMKEEMKKPGFRPPTDIADYQKIPILSLGQLVIESPPFEKDQMKSIFSKDGFGQRWQNFKGMFQSTIGVAIAKRHMKGFKVREFAEQVEQVYIRVNTALATGDSETLKTSVTGNVYLKMIENGPKRKGKVTPMWKVEQIMERPRMVALRAIQVESAQDTWIQVMVRLHHRQVWNGAFKGFSNDNTVTHQEVIEYVVLERHVVDPDSQWLICGKIVKKNPQEQ
eukprot:comp18513_c0_seq1/m.19912 comp18513_c0_seq1/g.19912  ORF comp18513_c0_seq1/g.19912 comp18513_c0_seq1/m.19912 type:complete len:276 (-) comp18513_c0_seq1:505-1332(-)